MDPYGNELKHVFNGKRKGRVGAESRWNSLPHSTSSKAPCLGYGVYRYMLTGWLQFINENEIKIRYYWVFKYMDDEDLNSNGSAGSLLNAVCSFRDHMVVRFLPNATKTVLVKDNPSGDFWSIHWHISKGSWTFSDQDHGWQVSDCTAEALKCCLLFSTMPLEIFCEKMQPGQLYDVVNVLLSIQ
ncbi:hypothetical protein M8C21_012478, partial [Ambrosia artemisiifolia]